MLRLKTRPQFQAALAGKTLSKTAHFALHACALPQPEDSAPARSSPASKKLFASVDIWLGAMVPKRWAKRAATRNLIKRQIYAISAQHQHALGQGAHVVRLRSSFALSQFPSASSDALKSVVHQELLQLFARPIRVQASTTEVAA